VTGWDDLYTTGFFEYIDAGCILAVEWSENIEAALPPGTVRVRFTRLGDTKREIRVLKEEGERMERP
jgi:hydrolase, P-loop family